MKARSGKHDLKYYSRRIEAARRIERKNMELNLQQERQQAHALIDLLPPAKLEAVRNLLEVFLDEDSDTLSPAEAKAIAEADEWSKHNAPIPHEQVLAEFGLSMAD
jgi:hypothetical protein